MVWTRTRPKERSRTRTRNVRANWPFVLDFCCRGSGHLPSLTLEETNILVFDMGGGTFDVSVLAIQELFLLKALSVEPSWKAEPRTDNVELSHRPYRKGASQIYMMGSR